MTHHNQYAIFWQLLLSISVLTVELFQLLVGGPALTPLHPNCRRTNGMEGIDYPGSCVIDNYSELYVKSLMLIALG